MRKTILAVFALLTLAGAVSAAETEQKYGFHPDAFEIKYYIQPRYSWYSEPIDLFDEEFGNGTDNYFNIRRSRIYLTSNITPNIKGRVQVEAKPDEVEALDVYFDWAFPLDGKQPLAFRLGQFKKPFSYQEFVMSSNDLNLIERTFTHAVLSKKVLASDRDQGVMATGDLWEYDIPVMLHLGVFNGNGIGRKFDSNSGKQVVARGEVTPLTGVSLGGNIAVNRRGFDGFVIVESDTVRNAPRDYTVWGADLVLAKNEFQVVAEVFGGDNSPRIVDNQDLGEEVGTFFAWYAEAVYRAKSGWEPAARIEIYDPDTDTEDDGRTILTGQIAYSFSRNFRWQVNVAHQTFQDDAKDSLTGVVSQWTLRL